MTMQDALSAAHLKGCYARPAPVRTYSYQYVLNGMQLLVEVTGVPSRCRSRQSGFWRTMTRREIEADWILCDVDGNEIVARPPVHAGSAPTLTDFL